MGICNLLMVHLVISMATTTMVAEYRCASMRSTIQCVVRAGMTWKLLSFATILVTAHIVCSVNAALPVIDDFIQFCIIRG